MTLRRITSTLAPTSGSGWELFFHYEVRTTKVRKGACGRHDTIKPPALTCVHRRCRPTLPCPYQWRCRRLIHTGACQGGPARTNACCCCQCSCNPALNNASPSASISASANSPLPHTYAHWIYSWPINTDHAVPPPARRFRRQNCHTGRAGEKNGGQS